jgi:hypothetical protein
VFYKRQLLQTLWDIKIIINQMKGVSSGNGKLGIKVAHFFFLTFFIVWLDNVILCYTNVIYVILCIADVILSNSYGSNVSLKII